MKQENYEKCGGFLDPDRYTWTEVNLDGTKTRWVKKPAYQELQCGMALASFGIIYGVIIGVVLF